MTDQTPEVPEDVVEATDELATVGDDVADEAGVVEIETEPETLEAEVVADSAAGSEADASSDTEIVEAEVVGLDLGQEAPATPIGTDFEVAESPHFSEASPTREFEVGQPAAPVPPPTSPAPPAEPITPTAPVPPAVPVASPPTGGSFLDLPPLPDLNFPAPTPPPASPYPPPAAFYPQASNYPQPAPQPAQTEYAPYPSDYSAQAAGQAYGHGAPAPRPQPAPMVPANPYGTPTGFAVQPYQQAHGDVTLASAAHWGALVANVLTGTGLGFLVPLILMQTAGKTDPFVRANAVESLNFSLTMLLGMVISLLLLLVFVGIIGVIAIPVVTIIFQILGALAANRGEVYRYPISIRFVK